MDVVKRGEIRSLPSKVSFSSEGEPILEAGEPVVWQGVVSEVSLGRVPEGKKLSDGVVEPTGRIQRANVLLTDRRLHYWTTDLSGNPFTQRNTGWVVGGVLGMTAENLIKKRKLKGLVLAGQLHYWEISSIQLVDRGEFETVRLVLLPYGNDTPFEVVDWTFHGEGAQWIAETVTAAAARERLDRLGTLKSEYPHQSSLLENQARTPTRNTWGTKSYAIPMFYSRSHENEIPWAVTVDRYYETLVGQGRAEMAEVELEVANQEHGVRSNDPNRPSITIQGYSFVLPAWWESVPFESPPANLVKPKEIASWVSERFGAFAGGSDHWQEALKIWVTAIQWEMPPEIALCYEAGGLRVQAAIAAIDTAELGRKATSDSQYFRSGPHINAEYSWRAGNNFRMLGKDDAARMWLRRALRIGGRYGKAAEKDLTEMSDGAP